MKDGEEEGSIEGECPEEEGSEGNSYIRGSGNWGSACVSLDGDNFLGNEEIYDLVGT